MTEASGRTVRAANFGFRGMHRVSYAGHIQAIYSRIQPYTAIYSRTQVIYKEPCAHSALQRPKTVQYTRAVSPGLATPDSDWITAGQTVTMISHLRHVYSIEESGAAVQGVTGIRILVSAEDCIDELEVYETVETRSCAQVSECGTAAQAARVVQVTIQLRDRVQRLDSRI